MNSVQGPPPGTRPTGVSRNDVLEHGQTGSMNLFSGYGSDPFLSAEKWTSNGSTSTKLAPLSQSTGFATAPPWPTTQRPKTSSSSGIRRRQPQCYNDSLGMETGTTWTQLSRPRRPAPRERGDGIGPGTGDMLLTGGWAPLQFSAPEYSDTVGLERFHVGEAAGDGCATGRHRHGIRCRHLPDDARDYELLQQPHSVVGGRDVDVGRHRVDQGHADWRHASRRGNDVLIPRVGNLLLVSIEQGVVPFGDVPLERIYLGQHEPRGESPSSTRTTSVLEMTFDPATSTTLLMGSGGTWSYVATAAPSAPTSPVATAGDGQVQLSWGAPASDGNTALHRLRHLRGHWHRRRGLDADQCGSNCRDITHGGVRLHQRSDQNSSRSRPSMRSAAVPPRPSSSATPSRPTTPGAPSGLQAAEGDGTVTLILGRHRRRTAARASPATSIFVGTSSYGEWPTPVNTTPVIGTQYPLSGLTDGTQYYFFVEAVNALGTRGALEPGDSHTRTARSSRCAHGSGSAGWRRCRSPSGGRRRPPAVDRRLPDMTSI